MNREVGKVKWYGGLNSKTGRVNDYGFISHIINADDLYFHKRDIKCSTNLIQENSIVSFFIKTITDKNGKQKLQAIDINIIENEENIQAITTCALSNQTYYWLPVFTKYLKNIMDNRSQSIDELVSLCIKKNNSLGYQKDSFLKSLPSELYIYSPEIRKLLKPEAYIARCSQIIDEYEDKVLIKELCQYISSQESQIDSKTICKYLPQKLLKYTEIYELAPDKIKANYIINTTSDGNLSEFQLNELISIIKTINQAEQDYIWKDLPKELLKYPEIYEIAPYKRKADYIISLATSDDISNTLLKEVISILKKSNEEERDYILSILPSNLKLESVIFPFLNPTDQVDIIWEDFKYDPVNIWEKLSNKAKVFSLYRAVQENLDLSNFIIKAKCQDDEIVSFVLKLCSYPQISFIQIHEDLIRLIVKVDGDISKLFPLIIGEDLSYMMLINTSDSIYDMIGSLEKAEKPNYTYYLDFKDFLDTQNVEVKFPRITLDTYQYIQKLKAWANFVKKNSERLKCSFCKEIMTFNPVYSKYSTVQEITVFWCPDAHPRECLGIAGLDGSNHNFNVYINYCWNCFKTVDSRDSFQTYGLHYKSDGWVTCIHCGAGRKPGY